MDRALKDLGVTTITDRNTAAPITSRSTRRVRASVHSGSPRLRNAHASLEHGHLRALAARRPGAAATVEAIFVYNTAMRDQMLRAAAAASGTRRPALARSSDAGAVEPWTAPGTEAEKQVNRAHIRIQRGFSSCLPARER